MAATVASSVGATLSLSLVAGGFGDDLKHARTMAAWPWPRFPSRSRMASSHLLKKNRGYAKLKKLDIAKFNIDQTNEKGNTEREKLEERGVWLPSAPRIEKLRAFYNASSLAYLGDAVFEDALLRQLLKEEFLSDEERDVVRWGRNATVGKGRAIRRAGSAVYSNASSFETLIGYLYVMNVDRLDALMNKLGFKRDQ
ncbi:hypothetical protein O6H91_14G026600 [Diphasiastrum complanatum]|uniref:Uncharacterized protein n=1 Tax=Diphasiastrum complanatum TaxID=34168 RepID=A0ACC2BN89_DIPCM|nr:hypothetical protein O6H91_14G026600 [Diphasiastrum complanatum]